MALGLSVFVVVSLAVPAISVIRRNVFYTVDVVICVRCIAPIVAKDDFSSAVPVVVPVYHRAGR